MVKNIDLRELWKNLSTAKSVVLFPHVNPDGDAVGACVALCLTLREHGVDCKVCSGKVPDYLGFLNTSYFIDDREVGNPEICVAVDCSEDYRMDRRGGAFYRGNKHYCIDHHQTDCGFGDRFYIDGAAAAACTIIFDMLKEAGAVLSRDAANAIYTGICTDTGNFKHANTDSRSHNIAAELLEVGVDHTEIMASLYKNRSMKKVLCESRAIEKAFVFSGGRGIISYLSSEEMAKINATHEDTDEIIDKLRDIAGVEMAAYLEEREEGIKISMRAKTYGNVRDICRSFGGGGHIAAAGATVKMSMEDAFAAVKRAIEESL
ncbi:MAG: bifunctional oligoribonuclease/PAP phosphatase NrnA [Eubacteriales bacterium]|nr:bifunctional oligoribonuclease/PAP phosphatase NrnA [Eubacteriales bacterium]